MKTFVRAGVLLFVATLVATASASGTMSGIWHGRIRFDMGKLPPLKNPRLNATRVQKLMQIQQMELTLTVKGDHTYTLRSIGGPKMTPQITGRWRLEGDNLFLQQTDKGLDRGYPQVYTVEKTGHSFAVTKEQAGMMTTISFFR